MLLPVPMHVLVLLVQLLLDRVDGAADDGADGSTIATTLVDDATDVVPA